MDRLACVNLPAFPLQLLCMRHPEWRGHPTVVVTEDKPQGIITWVDEAAHNARIRPGQRYAQALSLANDLRAGVIDDAEVARAVLDVCERLRRFSPHIEPYDAQPGVFWIDASGLDRLYPSLTAWAREIAEDLRQADFQAALTVGFSRFGTYALARVRPHGYAVFTREIDERLAARDVPLDRLDIKPRLRDSLHRLGVTTVGEFVRLPAGGLLKRFGKAAHQLHVLAAGERWDPLRPAPPPDPAIERIEFDDPVKNSERLLFAIKRALDPLLGKLASRQRALSGLIVKFTFERHDPPTSEDLIRPAEPTLDARTLLRLLHLRLEHQPAPAGVSEIELSCEEVPATREQLQLFARKPRRDLRAANEAVARLRAELGNDAVMKATIRDGHLPEARFAWEQLTQVSLPNPEPEASESRSLIRRVRARPKMLPPQEHRYRDDGWLLGSLEQGPVVNVLGPYVVSGGWWVNDIHREYHFAETRRGDCLWVYYDRRRRRWFLQGRVE